MHRQARSQELQDCIQSCKDCHAVCVETEAYCLKMGGAHVAATHMGLLLDCAQICTPSEDFMLRDSQSIAQLCGLCADICDSCARSCAQFKGDQQMQDCASVCGSCASACRKMAASQSSHAAHASHATRTP